MVGFVGSCVEFTVPLDGSGGVVGTVPSRRLVGKKNNKYLVLEIKGYTVHVFTNQANKHSDIDPYKLELSKNKN